jgi:hypothetical protein
LRLKAYYYEYGFDPIIFWRFDGATLPPGVAQIQETTTSGDECHYNLLIAEDAAEDFFDPHRDPQVSKQIFACPGDGVPGLTTDHTFFEKELDRAEAALREKSVA